MKYRICFCVLLFRFFYVAFRRFVSGRFLFLRPTKAAPSVFFNELLFVRCIVAQKEDFEKKSFVSKVRREKCGLPQKFIRKSVLKAQKIVDIFVKPVIIISTN